jgi:hypothetical protein
MPKFKVDHPEGQGPYLLESIDAAFRDLFA